MPESKKKTPKDLIREAVKGYYEEHGATSIGSYRDVITDLLHIAAEDKSLYKDLPKIGKRTVLHYILDEGYDMYQEERRNAETEMVGTIKKENLPLHINDDFEFEENKEFFKSRLSGGKNT